MNDKKLEVVSSVLKKRIPFIDGIKLRQSSMSHYIRGEYIVEVECDFDIIKRMYPNSEVDEEYIMDNMVYNDNKIYISNPYDVFVYPPEEGDKVRKLILELSNSIGVDTARIQFVYDIDM